jgi:hypothetical protein
MMFEMDCNYIGRSIEMHISQHYSIKHLTFDLGKSKIYKFEYLKKIVQKEVLRFQLMGYLLNR